MDTNSSVSQIYTDITSDGSMIDRSRWLRHLQVFPRHCCCGVSASVAVAAALHQRTASGDDRRSLRKKEETGNDEKMWKKRWESIRNSESMEFFVILAYEALSILLFFPCLIEWCVLWFMCLSWFSTFGPRVSRSAWSPSLMVSRQGHIWFHWNGHGFAENCHCSSKGGPEVHSRCIAVWTRQG